MASRRCPRMLAGLFALTMVAAAAASGADTFVNFESGHVRPLALSDDGGLLFAVDTPDNRLAIYDVTAGGLVLAAEVPVGLEPVAVAVRTPTEVWVVNHLSDSVSVVAVDADAPARSRVVRTLLVGDEPRDLVFAGAGNGRAFVTAAHRGQNRPGDPQLTINGVGRADVWVFDASDLGAPLGGTPLAVLELFGDTPRALAVSPDGATVYAAVFQSGNLTASIGLAAALRVGSRLAPPPDGSTPGAPATGLIVRKDPQTRKWLDDRGVDFSDVIDIDLLDRDVFAIDATADPPAVTRTVTGVGTTLFAMAVRPGTDHLFVANVEARNDVRFVPALRGHTVENRITVVADGSAAPAHLNPHIDYGTLPGPQSEIDATLALPVGLGFTADGATLAVAAMGSDAVALFDAGALEAGRIERRVVRVGAGPSGLVVDDARRRLYVMNRVDHSISIVDLAGATEAARLPLRFDPSPPAVRAGRRFLYDARGTSGHGDTACGSCHLFGDADGLGWDLGVPTAPVLFNPGPRFDDRIPSTFHPLKGPMSTRTLRGLPGTGPLHWRGDRSGGLVPGGDTDDTRAALHQFNEANFVGLMGRAAPLTTAEMDAFIDFILTLRQPPNPVRALDGVPTQMEAYGEEVYLGLCEFCHRLPIGTNRGQTFDFLPQAFKVPEARSTYQKVGRFGGDIVDATSRFGPQVRGFGYLHDGSASLSSFTGLPLFNIPDPVAREATDHFQLAFDTGLRPIVGQQLSVGPLTGDDPDALARLSLLEARATAGDCDLVVRGLRSGDARGWLHIGGGSYQPDRAGDPPVTTADLRDEAAVAGQERTFTCVPPGSGRRIALDRDEDNALDRDEVESGTDPADPTSGGVTTTTTSTTTTTLPPFVPVTRIRATWLRIVDDSAVSPTGPTHGALGFTSNTRRDPPANRIVPPEPGGPFDPRTAVSWLVVHRFPLIGDLGRTVLGPAGRWEPIGSTSRPRGYRYRGGPGELVRKVVLRHDHLEIRTRGPMPSFTLDEPRQGTVGVQLQIRDPVYGRGPTWCTEAQARRIGQPTSSAKYDRPGLFVSRGGPPASVCLPY